MSENDALDPTPEEAAAAEALRKALDENAANDDADFLRSLKAAHAPGEIDARTNDALIERALARKPSKSRRGVVIRVTFGVAAVFAVAAAIFLVLGQVPGVTPAPPRVELARVRSTQPLFDKPFDKETSARVDRIAMARASDLRENRFAQWGVR